jgi:hypothetical protein
MIVAAATIAATLSIGYRTGRAHHSTHHYVPARRRQVWSEARIPLISAALLLALLFAAGWQAGQ